MTRRILPSAPSSTIGSTVLPMAEVVVDQTNKQLRIGDGSTPGGLRVPTSADLALSGTAAGIGFTRGTTGAVSSNVAAELKRELWVEQLGGVGNGSTDCTTPLLRCISELRANSVVIATAVPADSGATVTAYSSGTVRFGYGAFVVSADALDLTQDLGLTLKGMGSRGSNNAVKAPTTLIISGTSSGFGIRVRGNGARALRIEDMDVVYATSGFTGDLLDIYSTPGVTLTRVTMGTRIAYGSGRLASARSLIRCTYDEFLSTHDCVFDGAVDMIWSDDTRDSGPFGGSQMTHFNPVFYDCTGAMIKHAGNRTRQGLTLVNPSFNPISVDCIRAIDITNLDGYNQTGGTFTPSVANKATTEWMRLANTTGKVSGATFDDLSKAGTLDGVLTLEGNRIYCTDGFTLKGGVIVSRANEFSQGSNGFTASPTYPLCLDLGPDLFKAGVTGRSYDIPSDSANLSGRINYNADNDASGSKFRNTSARVTIKNVDDKLISVSGATYTIDIVDTGRKILATGGANQTFALPPAMHGTNYQINKISGVNLTINCAAGDNLYGTGTTAYTSAAMTGTAQGGLVLTAYADVGWVVEATVGTWTFT